MIILNYLSRISSIFTSKSEERHNEFFTIKQSVGLLDPRLDCTVVMNHCLSQKQNVAIDITTKQCRLHYHSLFVLLY